MVVVPRVLDFREEEAMKGTTKGGPSPRPSPHPFVAGRGRGRPCAGATPGGDCIPSYGLSCMPAFPLPSRSILALGAVALCVMMGEEAMAVWGAAFLLNCVGTRDSFA